MGLDALLLRVRYLGAARSGLALAYAFSPHRRAGTAPQLRRCRLCQLCREPCRSPFGRSVALRPAETRRRRLLLKALGTVFTERVVDSLLIVFLTVAAFFWQVPAFKRFLDETGMNLRSFLGRFTETGYLVTIACIVAAVALVLTLVARYMKKGKKVLKNLWAGVSSLRKLKNLPLFLFGV